jgi:hypothetical protein
MDKPESILVSSPEIKELPFTKLPLSTNKCLDFLWHFRIQMLTKFLASLLWFKIFSRFYNKTRFFKLYRNHRKRIIVYTEPEISPEVEPKQDAHTETHVYPKTSLFSNKNDSQKSEQVGLAIVIFLVHTSNRLRLICLLE